MGRGYCLKWNKYSTVFQSSFGGLYASQELTDVTFVCEGQFLKCHRVVISAASQYFRDILVRLHESNPVVVLTDVKYSVFKALIDFIYCGEIEVHHELLEAVVKAGEKFHVKGLKEGDEHDYGRDVPHSSFETPTTPVVAKRRKIDDGPLYIESLRECETPLQTPESDNVFAQPLERLPQPISVESAQGEKNVKEEFCESLSTADSFLREAESADFDAYEDTVADDHFDQGEIQFDQTEYSVQENDESTMNVELGTAPNYGEIHQGTRFSSFQQMQYAIDSFCKVEGIKVFRKDSKTIQKALQEKQIRKKALRCDPRLVYYKLEFCCVQGGKKYRSKGTGERTPSTLRLDCPFNMKIGVTADGRYLEVHSFKNEHNHRKGVLERITFGRPVITYDDACE